MTFLRIAALLLILIPINGTAEELGSVDTKWRPLSPDDEITVDVFEDDKIAGVACYISRAQIGGYKGAMGLAEDTSDASLDCRQVGPISIRERLKKGESVFSERRSLIFKRMKVLRYCDIERNVIVYMVYSEKIVDGSPKNSVSAVPIMHWGGSAAGQALARCVYTS